MNRSSYWTKSQLAQYILIYAECYLKGLIIKTAWLGVKGGMRILIYISIKSYIEEGILKRLWIHQIIIVDLSMQIAS